MDDVPIAIETRSKCKAHSSRTGLPCRQNAILGGTVCVAHGGRAPQVKLKAEQRILKLVNPALAALKELVDKGEGQVRLGAARDILDRAGLGAKFKLELAASGSLDLNVTSSADELRSRIASIAAHIEAPEDPGEPQ